MHWWVSTSTHLWHLWHLCRLLLPWRLWDQPHLQKRTQLGVSGGTDFLVYMLDMPYQ